MEIVLADYADYILFKNISKDTLTDVFFLHYNEGADIFLRILLERLMHWPHNNVFIICPNEIYKYDYGLQKSVASKIDIQDVTQGIILNLTGPPFSPRHRTESVRQFLIKLQQRCPICSIPVANSVWAKKLFGQMPSEDQMSMLWHTILSFFPSPPVRENIFTHIFSVQKRAVELSQQHFSSLRLTNNEGTDLLIQLHPRHQWITSFKDGCCANILTNEVYTIPLKDGVTGIYKCRGPAEINGAILHNIELSFASGKATIVNVEGDSRHLEELLDMDYGSAYMGEIALVMDEEVKVQKKSTLNSLLDENLFCHFALGNAYVDCLIQDKKRSIKDLLREKVNISSVHADFWISSVGLSVLGILGDGKKIVLLNNGNSVW